MPKAPVAVKSSHHILRLPGIDGRALSQMTAQSADKGLLPLEQGIPGGICVPTDLP